MKLFGYNINRVRPTAPRRRRELAKAVVPATENTGRKTWAKSWSRNKFMDFLNPLGRDVKQLAQFKAAMTQYGLVCQCVEAYKEYVFSNGWRFESNSPSDMKKVEEALKSIDFEKVASQLLGDGIGYGDGFSEVAGVMIYSIPNETMKVVDDAKTGGIAGYEQYIRKDGIVSATKKIPLPIEKIMHFQPYPQGGSNYGLSILQMAWTEICRDSQISDSVAAAIERHGFPKYLVQVGREGTDPDPILLQSMSNEFEDINSKNTFITSPDLKVSNIDTTGIGNIRDYGDWGIQRVLASLGVPEEVLGLHLGGSGSEATSKIRLEAFYDKVSTLQRKLAECFNRQYIDRITGHPGAVKLVFNEISSESRFKGALFIAQVAMAEGLDKDSILSREEKREAMGYTSEFDDGEEPPSVEIVEDRPNSGKLGRQQNAKDIIVGVTNEKGSV